MSETAQTYLEQLKEFTDELLTQNHPGKLRGAAFRLHSLFSGITGLSDDVADSENHRNTILPTGKAISPVDAGRCVFDFMRTAKFLRGLNDALLELQKRFPGERLEILYAGCGPFATLIAPLATKFGAGQIQISLLDIHDRSLKSVRLVFKACGLEAYLGDCVQADASAYRHPRPLHLVVTETMQMALRKEPQVAVSYNLAPQLREGGILVPQKITVDACLYNPATEITFVSGDGDCFSAESAENKRVRIKVGRIFEMTAENRRDTPERQSLPPVVLALPKPTNEKLKLLLATTVTVFESVVLEEYDSGITYPYMLKGFAPDECGDRIEFTYHLGSRPEFRYRCLNPKPSAETISI